MPRPVANLLMLFAGLLWGGGFIAQDTAMDHIGPFAFLGVRFAIASLAILPFIIVMERRNPAPPLTRHDFKTITLTGIVFFIGMMMQQVGLLATSVTNAGMLTGLYVVLVPIIAFLVLKAPQPSIIWPCALMAFTGIWLLGGGGLDRFTWGDWLIFVSAFFAALHVLSVDWSVRQHHRPYALALGQFMVAAIAGLSGYLLVRLLGWSHEPPMSVVTLTGAAPELLYAALFAGAMAFTIMSVCQQYSAPATAAILLSSEALFAALGGAVILGERLDWLGYLGCALLFAAIVIVSFASARHELRVEKAAA